MDIKATPKPNYGVKDICHGFGARVRELRTAKGLSQEAFAHRCGLDRTYLSGVERGVRNPSLRNIARIAEQLGVPLSTLFKGLPLRRPAQ